MSGADGVTEQLRPWRSAKSFRCSRCGGQAVRLVEISYDLRQTSPYEYDTELILHPENPFCDPCASAEVDALMDADASICG